MTVKAVLFDVGGVFFIPHHEVLRPLLSELGFASPDDDVFHQAHYEGIRYSAGEDSDAHFWTGYNHRYVGTLGVDHAQRDRVAQAMRDVWLSGLNLWSWLQEQNVRALADIAAQYRIGIVSNADGTVEAMLREHAVCQVGDGPGVPVEVVVDSTAVGVAKPDPTIFDHALKPMGLSPDEVVYVGDTYRYDVVGARRARIRPIHLDPYDLHGDHDHDRVRSLDDVVALLKRL